jgi:hypothetical protein
MSTHQSRLTGTNSLIAVAAMTVVTSIHHVYRLGLEVLVPALVLIALPVLLLRWQRRSGRRVALWAYAGLNLLTFSWFAFVDGFLDHVIKALGLQNTTFLPGGDAETVPTVFHLWSPTSRRPLLRGYRDTDLRSWPRRHRAHRGVRADFAVLQHRPGA